MDRGEVADALEFILKLPDGRTRPGGRVRQVFSVCFVMAWGFRKQKSTLKVELD